ncbi:hypothetical protein ACJJI4_03670 [Microbulbifer sp. TRSA002]|uniref:hypothetical protein n=1 Tax=Microbulbifer sp. TRSA002 TaxID=3243382 RepID=UPI00403990CC
MKILELGYVMGLLPALIAWAFNLAFTLLIKRHNLPGYTSGVLSGVALLLLALVIKDFPSDPKAGLFLLFMLIIPSCICGWLVNQKLGSFQSS